MANKINKITDIIIRKVQSGDENSIFSLSNQPSIRKWSFHGQVISRETHHQWFSKIINDKTCIFLVAVLHDKIIGQIRLTIKNKKALISLSVDEQFIGQGVGSLLIKKGIIFLKKEKKDITKIIAQIKNDNDQSIRFFKKNGFCFKSTILIHNATASQYELTLS